MFETRTLTGLVINHLSAGCLLAIAVFVTPGATSETLPGTRTAAACIESNTCHTCREDGGAVQSNNPSQRFTSPTSHAVLRRHRAKVILLSHVAQRRSALVWSLLLVGRLR
jgi:hypothetical protein